MSFCDLVSYVEGPFVYRYTHLGFFTVKSWLHHEYAAADIQQISNSQSVWVFPFSECTFFHVDLLLAAGELLPETFTHAIIIKYS